MRQPRIINLSELEAPFAGQTAALLVESFYTVFRGISKDREILRRLFTPSLRPEAFYVQLDEDRVIGLIAISDSDNRAISVDAAACVSAFGKMKGKLLRRQMGNMLEKPAVTDPKSGYIDFLATAPDCRRRGIAAGLLTFAEENSRFSHLYLDVLASNAPAIGLYRNLGYEIVTAKHDLLMRMAGIGEMYIMKKTLD